MLEMVFCTWGLELGVDGTPCSWTSIVNNSHSVTQQCFYLHLYPSFVLSPSPPLSLSLSLLFTKYKNIDWCTTKNNHPFTKHNIIAIPGVCGNNVIHAYLNMVVTAWTGPHVFCVNSFGKAGGNCWKSTIVISITDSLGTMVGEPIRLALQRGSQVGHKS